MKHILRYNGMLLMHVLRRVIYNQGLLLQQLCLLCMSLWIADFSNLFLFNLPQKHLEIIKWKNGGERVTVKISVAGEEAQKETKRH